MVYTQGVYQAYTSLYIPTLCVPGVYLPVYTTLYTPWVHHPTTLSGMVNVPVDSSEEEKRPWAQCGRFPWVGKGVRVNVVNSVMRRGTTLRIVTPLFPENVRQRLDRRRVYPRVFP